MEELQSTVVEWINSLKLSKKCEKLSDLSDGILLFEFMSKVSHEFFDIECLTLAPGTNWALRLSNLKKLKKSLTSYTDQVLKMPYKCYDAIDLSSIARKDEPKEIFFLLEFVVYATVNSPYKEEFIKKIMELDEDGQTVFMYFIQKALGECDSPLFDPNIRVENREVLILRTEKQRLAVQIEELLKEVKEYKASNQQLVKEKEELLLEVTDLKSDMSKKSRINLADFADPKEIELRLAEKDVKIMQLTNYLADLKNATDKEINRIRDELDVANAKVFGMGQMEKTLAQYKKRIEALTTVKNRMEELEKENDELHDQLELKSIEIENLGALKKTLKGMKDELATEKKNSDNLSYKFEMLKKDLKKKENEVEELKQKLLVAEVRAREIERNELNSSVNSDDSILGNKLIELEEVYSKPLEVRKESRRLTVNVEMEQIRKEKLIMQVKLNKSKAKTKMFREQAQMLSEELNTCQVEKTNTISQLHYQLGATTSQLQVVSQTVSAAQGEKIKLEQCSYELEQVKNTKEHLINEVKKLYEEKDQAYKKLLECREESMNLQNIVNHKEVQIREKEINERIMTEKLQALMESEKVSAVMIESLKKQEGGSECMIKLVETEKEVINLKSEKNELKFRIQEKDERIEEVLKEKNEVVKMMEREHKEALARMKEGNNRMMNQIMNQCDEAITELQKERELVMAQLRIEKKNAIQEWKKPMDSGWTQSSKEEINRLKDELGKKEKEIVKLSKSNQEIKKCWKESTKLLKDVWKQIREETEKIQKASKGYK